MSRGRSILASVACVVTLAQSGAAAEPQSPAGATARAEYAIVAVERRPRGVAVLPALGRVYTVSDAGGRGTVDAYDLALHRTASARICPRPVWIVGDGTSRLLIACRMMPPPAFPGGPNAGFDPQLDVMGDQRGDVIVVDARRLATVAHVRDVDTSTVAAFAAGTTRAAYVERTDGALLRVDPMTGATAAAAPLSGATSGTLRLIAGDSPASLLVVDEHDDALYKLGPDGKPARALQFGMLRMPASASVSGNVALVALANSGSVARVDLSRNTIIDRVPTGDWTKRVVADPARNRWFAIAQQAATPGEAGAPGEAVSWFDEGGLRRGATPIAPIEQSPYAPIPLFSALDPTTGRLVVATEHQVAVVDPAGGSFSVQPDFGHGITGLAVDTVHGIAYAPFGSAAGAGIARLGIRGGAPTMPDITGLIAQPPEKNTGTGYNYGLAYGPPQQSAPGARSPAELALRADATLAVLEVDAPAIGTIGTSPNAVYREQRIATTAAPLSLALAPDGTLWFSEMTSYKRGIVAQRRADGSVVEITLPSERPDKIVAAPDGVYWLVRRHPSLLGRIAHDGTVSIRPSRPASATGRDDIFDIAAMKQGGCYVLYADAIEQVGPDGTRRFLARLEPSAGFGENALAALADGSIAVSDAGRLRLRDPAGGISAVVVEHAAGTSAWSTVQPHPCTLSSLAEGPGGTVWGACNNDIVSVTRTGAVRRFALPFPQSHPRSLVRAPDGSMWFAEPTQSRLGRIAPDGTLHEITI